VLSDAKKHCKIVFVEVESNVNDHDKGITKSRHISLN